MVELTRGIDGIQHLHLFRLIIKTKGQLFPPPFLAQRWKSALYAHPFKPSDRLDQGFLPSERGFIEGREYSPIEVAAYEVAENDGKVEEKDLPEVGSPEVERGTKVIECVGDAVRKATHDEQGNAKEQREVLTLTSKGDGSSHDETAADGEHATLQRTNGQTPLEHALCRRLQGHGGAAGNKGYGQTTDDVTD